MLTVLRGRNFALLWVGGLVSIAGDYVLFAALPFFVYEQTGSTVATAGMIVAELAPGIVVGSIAGVFVDRWDRKRTLVLANLVQAGTVALLLLVPLGGWLWVVFVVAAMQSLLSSFSVPAEAALLPALVGPESLVPANALAALNNRLGKLVGVPVGGLLLGLVGLRAVVLVDLASFVAAALLISLVAAPAAARAAERAAEATSFVREWLDGVALVRSDRQIAVIFAVLGVMTFGGTMLDPLFVAWVRDVLDAGPDVYGWLVTASAGAGIAGALVVGHLGERLSPRALMGWSSIVAGGLLALRWNIPSIPLALVLAVLGGLTSVASSVGVQTVIQQGVDDRYRGRIFGALGASSSLLSLAGAATGGLLGEAIGIVPTLNLSAALIALSGLVVLRAIRPARPLQETDPGLLSDGYHEPGGDT